MVLALMLQQRCAYNYKTSPFSVKMRLISSPEHPSLEARNQVTTSEHGADMYDSDGVYFSRLICNS